MTTVELKVIRVVGAAIFDDQGRCLVTRRSAAMSQPDTWEFPGGKVERGESPQAALVREIREELDVEIEVGELLSVGMAPKSTSEQIRLDVYAAKLLSGSITLREHAEYRWCSVEELAELEWSAADVAIMEHLTSAL